MTNAMRQELKATIDAIDTGWPTRAYMHATQLAHLARQTAPKQSPKQAAYLFFLRNAGFGYDPQKESRQAGRSRCARELAKAERDARALGLEFTWEDSDECIGCDCDNPECKCSTGEPHESYWVACRDKNGQILASLGSVCEPTREYRRVVEAELAAEALAELEVGK